jgi:mono/diheme cytochrome c family protein
MRALTCSALAFGLGKAFATDISTEIGRNIYEEGRLSSGAPLVGARLGGVKIAGKQAACIQCHRPSGMGSVEGDFLVPPITGKALYGGGDKVIASMDPRRGRSFNQAHEPYTDASLSQAIRLGKHVSGRDMNVIMPRYQLSDAELQSLVAYLRQLSPAWSPGVEDNAIHFATVVTPEVPAARKQVFTSTILAAFAQKNANTLPGRRHMVSGPEMVLRTERPWKLHVWELQGSADTWPQQLAAQYDKQPVFALVSGLTDTTWDPMHTFCETRHVPCWFPSVPVTPTIAQQGKYSLYFSRGATLEAEVLAEHLSQMSGTGRVIQILSTDTSAATLASQAFEQRWATLQKDRPVAAKPERFSLDQWRAASGKLNTQDNLVLWLDAKDMESFVAAPMQAGKVFLPASLRAISGTAIPETWRDRVHLVYPYELPAKRGPSLAYFHNWLSLRRLPLADEVMQSEVYFAANYLTDTIAEMLDNLYRDYLIERAENMLSRWEARKAEDESRERGSLRRVARVAVLQGSAATPNTPSATPSTPITTGTTEVVAPPLATDMLVQRRAVSVYPRLSLGPGQRFASKGAYIVKLAADKNAPLMAETDWIIPQ